MLKDPLQLQKTPYEILEISYNANKEQIEQAFKKKVKEKRDIKDALNSRNILINPIKKELIDLFFYNKHFLKKLVPRINDDNLMLLKSNRWEVSQTWEKIKKDLFPHIASIHSLAVLWFWWAEFYEMYYLDKKINWHNNEEIEKNIKIINQNTIWENTISNWVFLIHSREFWEEWRKIRGVDSDIISNLPQALEDKFIHKLNFWEDKYKKIGENEYVKFFEEKKIRFNLEARTAKYMIKEHIVWRKGNSEKYINCGPIMVGQIGIKNDILNEYKNKDDLKILLSPFGIISILIEEKKYQDGLEKLDNIQGVSQEEINQWRAKIYVEQGKQFFNIEQFEKAFECWINALRIGKLCNNDVREIINLCKQEFFAQWSDAIKLLEEITEVIPSNIYNELHNELKKIISLIYLNKGINLIKKTIDNFKKSNSIKEKMILKSEIERGIIKIEKAVKLDPSNEFAKEQLEIAKGIIDEFEYLDIISYMEKKRWIEAIEKLEEMPEKEKTLDLLCSCFENVCWFCKEKRKNPSDRSKAKEVKMYKIVNRDFFSIRWASATPYVSRCKRCYRAHEDAKVFPWIGGIIGGLIGCLLSGIGGLFMFFFIGIIIGLINWHIKYGKYVKRENKYLDAPIIKKYKSLGFEFGEKPPNVS